VEWLVDAHAAQEKAKRENKYVLLDFTGSDWCGWCQKLKREVFDDPAFVSFAQANLVLVEVDFPHHKLMSREQKLANARLATDYGISGYPTIIVLDPDGKPVNRLGYVHGGPAGFISKLEAREKVHSKIIQAAEPVVPEPAPRKPFIYTPPPPTTPIKYGPLALKAISGSKNRRMVLINNASMMTGETAKVRAEEKTVVVACKEIRDDSVLITADGNPMELKLTRR